MQYSIEILEKERIILENCLKGFNKEDYPEAFKDRNKKHKELIKAIKYLKSNFII